MAISLDSYTSATTSSASSLLMSSGSTVGDALSYSEDEVRLSEEAMELLDELRYKENLSKITTENQRLFDRVSKALPATESFNDMLDWLTTLAPDEGFTIGGDMSENNRNIYEKDPEKYADMWGNMYNHFSDLMETLGIADDEVMMREVLSEESVSAELMMRFKDSFSEETNELLSFFNITV